MAEMPRNKPEGARAVPVTRGALATRKLNEDGLERGMEPTAPTLFRRLFAR
jgi:hypothetical protein